MSRLGFIGTGHIAAPIVRFLAARGHEIAVTRRNSEISAALHAELGVAVEDDSQAVLDGSDIVLVCLRPQHATEVLGGLTFRDDHQIVSVMAGVPRAALETLCAPATDFVQTIPLGFLQRGGCPLPAHGDAALLAGLFEPENPVIPVASEAALNAHFAICAMVPGLLDLMATGAGWLSRETGDPAGAERYTSQLVAGFLVAMAHGPGRLAAERDALATAGTLSRQMTDTLRTEGAHDALTTALAAINDRLQP